MRHLRRTARSTRRRRGDAFQRDARRGRSPLRRHRRSPSPRWQRVPVPSPPPCPPLLALFPASVRTNRPLVFAACRTRRRPTTRTPRPPPRSLSRRATSTTACRLQALLWGPWPRGFPSFPFRLLLPPALCKLRTDAPLWTKTMQRCAAAISSIVNAARPKYLLTAAFSDRRCNQKGPLQPFAWGSLPAARTPRRRMAPRTRGQKPAFPRLSATRAATRRAEGRGLGRGRCGAGRAPTNGGR